MKSALAAVLRSRIRVGSSETFAFQTIKCPKCKQTLRLHWPEYILHLPIHRVIWLDCPCCAFQFSVLAGELAPVCDSEEYVPAVVIFLS
jgi:hypothetical protein